MAAAVVSDGGSKGVDLAVVCRFWTDFDLESQRPKLDEVGLKIAEYQVRVHGLHAEKEGVRSPGWAALVCWLPGTAVAAASRWQQLGGATAAP